METCTEDENGCRAQDRPNIDRIANEGVLLTDAYGQNSCTAGRAAFITGQSPFRTGLLKVGLPGGHCQLGYVSTFPAARSWSPQTRLKKKKEEEEP